MAKNISECQKWATMLGKVHDSLRDDPHFHESLRYFVPMYFDEGLHMTDRNDPVFKFYFSPKFIPQLHDAVIPSDYTGDATDNILKLLKLDEDRASRVIDGLTDPRI